MTSTVLQVRADMLVDGERIEQERAEFARKEIEMAYLANARRHQWGSRTIAGMSRHDISFFLIRH